jgi:hypothetical protein
MATYFFRCNFLINLSKKTKWDFSQTHLITLKVKHSFYCLMSKNFRTLNESVSCFWFNDSNYLHVCKFGAFPGSLWNASSFNEARA